MPLRQGETALRHLAWACDMASNLLMPSPQRTYFYFLYALSTHDLCWEQAGEACPKRADASQALRPVFSQAQVKNIFTGRYLLQALPKKLLMLRSSIHVVDPLRKPHFSGQNPGHTCGAHVISDPISQRTYKNVPKPLLYTSLKLT